MGFAFRFGSSSGVSEKRRSLVAADSLMACGFAIPFSSPLGRIGVRPSRLEKRGSLGRADFLLAGLPEQGGGGESDEPDFHVDGDGAETVMGQPEGLQ